MASDLSSPQPRFAEIGAPLLIGAGIVLAAACTLIAYWPGLMTWDSM